MATPYHRGVIYAVPPEFNGKTPSFISHSQAGVESSQQKCLSFQNVDGYLHSGSPRLAPTVFSLQARGTATPPSCLFYHRFCGLSIYLIYLNKYYACKCA